MLSSKTLLRSTLQVVRCVPLVTLMIVGCAPGSPGLLVQASISARVDVVQPPPPPPKPAVALYDAEVVEFFGVPLDDANDVLFVLDVSGSMDGTATGVLATMPGDKNTQPDPNAPPPDPNAPPPAPVVPTKLEVARAELLAALQQLPDTTRTNVIFFNQDLRAFAASSVELATTRERMIGFVRSASATGGTALAPALRAAFIQNVPRVVVLSDGHGNVGGDDYDVLRDAREAMRGGTRIDTIGIGDHDRELLNALASESGGLYQSL